jgi:Trk K+ transport system NAD-binding subunit
LPFEKEMALKELVVKKWAGKPLRDLDLTNQYNAQILAIKRTGASSFKFIPKAADILNEGDIIIVLGNNVELTKIMP